MSKTAKNPGGANSGGPDLPFEEALQKLEAIVEAMESDELPLELLLARFEEGTRLSQMCQTKLAEAEVKIQQLEKTATGEPVLKPLTVAASASEQAEL
jgi:exodeoxyribonuclease VII small subunit